MRPLHDLAGNGPETGRAARISGTEAEGRPSATQGAPPIPTPHDLVDRYIAIWNETDAARRSALIAVTWTEDASYVDPLMNGEGRDGVDALAAGVQAQFPGLKFRRTSEVDAFADHLRFGWELGPDQGPALAGGVDFGRTVDGRLTAITGFLDFAPQA